jgi:hypothetical protein
MAPGQRDSSPSGCIKTLLLDVTGQADRGTRRPVLKRAAKGAAFRNDRRMNLQPCKSRRFIESPTEPRRRRARRGRSFAEKAAGLETVFCQRPYKDAFACLISLPTHDPPRRSQHLMSRSTRKRWQRCGAVRDSENFMSAAWFQRGAEPVFLCGLSKLAHHTL